MLLVIRLDPGRVSQAKLISTEIVSYPSLLRLSSGSFELFNCLSCARPYVQKKPLQAA